MISVFDDPDEIKVVSEEDKDIQAIIELAGIAIKNARKEKKLTQDKLGELSGISQKVIFFVETGKNFEFKTYVRLCLAMQLKPTFILRKFIKAGKIK